MQVTGVGVRTGGCQDSASDHRLRGPLNKREPTPTCAAEARAVRDPSLDDYLVSCEAHVDEHDSARAVRRVPEATEPTLALYRDRLITA